MPAFLEDIEGFYGTNEKNKAGDDLKSFLEQYDAKKYDNPSVTADIIVIKAKEEITTVNHGLQLLMVKRADHPCIGLWALPGGFVNIREDVEQAAKRELFEETGLDHIAIEQIYTWGEYDRDPRARIVTVAYLAVISEQELEVTAGDDAADATFADVTFEQIESKEISEKDKIKIENTYALRLTNSEKDFDLSATIITTQNKYGLLKEKTYRVVESSGIAFDHSRFIVQALLYIKDLLDC